MRKLRRWATDYWVDALAVALIVAVAVTGATLTRRLARSATVETDCHWPDVAEEATGGGPY